VTAGAPSAGLPFSCSAGVTPIPLWLLGTGFMPVAYAVPVTPRQLLSFSTRGSSGLEVLRQSLAFTVPVTTRAPLAGLAFWCSAGVTTIPLWLLGTGFTSGGYTVPVTTSQRLAV